MRPFATARVASDALTPSSFLPSPPPSSLPLLPPLSPLHEAAGERPAVGEAAEALGTKEGGGGGSRSGGGGRLRDVKTGEEGHCDEEREGGTERQGERERERERERDVAGCSVEGVYSSYKLLASGRIH